MKKPKKLPPSLKSLGFPGYRGFVVYSKIDDVNLPPLARVFYGELPVFEARSVEAAFAWIDAKLDALNLC